MSLTIGNKLKKTKIVALIQPDRLTKSTGGINPSDREEWLRIASSMRERTRNGCDLGFMFWGDVKRRVEKFKDNAAKDFLIKYINALLILQKDLVCDSCKKNNKGVRTTGLTKHCAHCGAKRCLNCDSYSGRQAKVCAYCGSPGLVYLNIDKFP